MGRIRHVFPAMDYDKKGQETLCRQNEAAASPVSASAPMRWLIPTPVKFYDPFEERAIVNRISCINGVVDHRMTAIKPLAITPLVETFFFSFSKAILE